MESIVFFVGFQYPSTLCQCHLLEASSDPSMFNGAFCDPTRFLLLLSSFLRALLLHFSFFKRPSPSPGSLLFRFLCFGSSTLLFVPTDLPPFSGSPCSFYATTLSFLRSANPVSWKMFVTSFRLDSILNREESETVKKQGHGKKRANKEKLRKGWKNGGGRGGREGGRAGRRDEKCAPFSPKAVQERTQVGVGRSNVGQQP